MTTLDALVSARELIVAPERWTQGYYARNKHGSKCGAFDSDAYCYCTSGALAKVCGIDPDGDGHARPYQDAIQELVITVGCGPIFFNDTHTHAEVLDMFDRTIKRLRAKQ